MAGNRRDWGLHAGHFAERHGLIVIIALGESLIVVGSALTPGAAATAFATGAVAVLMTCLLWWTYFGWVREVLEEELTKRVDRDRARLGRDAHTFGHFPLVVGVIALAVGFEGAFHPDDYSTTHITIAVGTGLALFLTATAGALWRAAGCVVWSRLVMLAVTLAVLALSAFSAPVQILGVGCGGLVVIVAYEQVVVRRKLARRLGAA
jgi:low temperature requirement protein LtrA